MSAPVLNVSAIAPVGTAPAAGAATPAAGFEALLAALFPQGPATGLTPQVPPTGGVEALKDTAEETAAPETEAQEAASAAEGTLEASLALITAQAPTPAASTPVETPAGEPEAVAPPAFGRGKPKGPAAPALTHADRHARLAHKAADAAEAVPETEAAERTLQPVRDAKAEPAGLAQAQGQAQANGVRTMAAQPPAPQAAPAPALDADLPPPTQPAGDAPVAAADDAAETASAIIAQNRPAEGVATPAAKPARARSERGKSEDALEAASPGAPRSANASGANPAAGAKPPPNVSQAAVTGAEATAPQDADATAGASGEPDFAMAAEAQTASQSAPAAALPAQHPVRGAPETVANLAAQIVKKLEGRSTRFDLELDPAGLGKVDVRVEIGRDGRISAAMAFDNPQAAQELKSRAGELTRALEQAGFDMSGGLSFDVAGDRGQQARQEWQAPDDTGNGLRGRAFQAALDTAGQADAAATSGALRLRRGVTAGLDVRI